MRWPHRLTISAPRTGGSATQSAVTGLLNPVTPGDEVIVYEGEGDLQDATGRETRPEDGARTVIYDGVGFLAVESAARRLAPQQTVRAVDAYGRERVAEILSVREVDATFLYRWRRSSASVAQEVVA